MVVEGVLGMLAGGSQDGCKLLGPAIGDDCEN